jgi:tetratricopeptide (TPR) repeat protein
VTDPRDTPLRPLEGVRDALATLRVGAADAEAERTALLRVCDAFEASLRRLLRDEPTAPLELRLKALAPDELSAEDLLSALRQRDRISLELAAAFHDLLGVRRRAQSGAAPTRRDAELALQVAERLEHDALPAAAAPSATPADVAAPESSPADEHELATRSLSRTQSGLPLRWGGVALAVLLLFGIGFWWVTARPSPRLDEAIALFRTGDYQRAAAEFSRYAAARPNDPTPRLYLARIYRRTGQHEQAQAQLRQALEIAPEDAALHRELGFLLLDVGQGDAAVGRFRAAINFDPAASEGWIGLVRALRETGQDAAAERVIARAPDEVRAQLQRAARPPP